MSKPPGRHRDPTSDDSSFSRPLDVHAVPEGGLDIAIEASADERAAITAELGLVAVGSLKAGYRIDRRAGGRLVVDGQLDAAITQTCVVTLEPFDSRIERAITLVFAPPANAVEVAPARSRRREVPVREEPRRPVVVPASDDQQDPPDPIIDGRIDLGAVALEFLTLSLDLYPRKPGVHFTDVSIGEKDEADSPFAALQRLKDSS